MQSTTYKPGKAFDLPNPADMDNPENEDHEVLVDDEDRSPAKSTRYRLWQILHNLQGFETRYALKTSIVISLLSIPAWLGQSSGWFNISEGWWAVVTAWIMYGPNFHVNPIPHLSLNDDDM